MPVAMVQRVLWTERVAGGSHQQSSWSYYRVVVYPEVVEQIIQDI